MDHRKPVVILKKVQNNQNSKNNQNKQWKLHPVKLEIRGVREDKQLMKIETVILERTRIVVKTINEKQHLKILCINVCGLLPRLRCPEFIELVK